MLFGSCRVCKLFRKLEVDNKVYLWQNLFRSHKVNMICLSTNPFHALKSFEESRRFRLKQSRKLRFTCSPPHSPVDDPLRELSAVIGDWKEACLKYGKWIIIDHDGDNDNGDDTNNGIISCACLFNLVSVCEAKDYI